MERTIQMIRTDLASGKPLSSADYDMLAKATKREEHEASKTTMLAKAQEIKVTIRDAVEGLGTDVPVTIFLQGDQADVFVGYKKGESFHFDMSVTGKGTTGIAYNPTRKCYVAAYDANGK